MLKKLGTTAVAISALSLTTMAFAGGPDTMAAPVVKAAHSNVNVFVGPELGMATTGDNVTSNYNASSLSLHSTHNNSNNSFLGGVLVGLQDVFANNVYAGVAFNALYNSLNTTFTNLSFSSGSNTLTTQENVKNDFQAGGDLRLGYQFDNIVTPYLLGGFEGGSWTLSANTTATGLPASNPSVNKTLIGPTAGAGILFSVPNSHWQTGLEYAYSWMGKVTATSNKGNTTFNLNQGQIMASASYLFNV